MRRITLWLICLLLLQVTPTAAIDDVPEPTGYIVFTSMRDGNREIYRYDVQHDDLTNLTNHAANEDYPTFSPDGRYMAFVTYRGCCGGQVFVLDILNGEMENVSPNPVADYRYIRWSPDGRYIAWEVDTEHRGNYDIYLYEVATGRYTSNLTDAAEADWAPAWSPDSTQIAFQSWRNGVFNLYVVDIETRIVRNISQSRGPDLLATWSPDGSQIAYVSERDGNAEIYLYLVETGITQRLTSNMATEWWPFWSPDGTTLAFSSNRDNPPDDYNVYLMNADGTNPHRLTDHPAWDEFNHWSPDGEWIVFTSFRSGGGDIYIVHVESGTLRQITHHPALDNHALWIAGE